ncbi:uncharacterized protein JCM15063_002994 [Sporobolomyces koalae]|uniref:uncharacterized protein n=1 Tax=Sporobolomyces koalae TaxID=500713 RepID=UPI00316EB7F2
MSLARPTGPGRTVPTDSQGEPEPAEPTLLDFDSEEDLLAMLDRLRQDLRGRLATAIEKAEHSDARSKGKGKEQLDKARVEDIVQRKFFEHVSQTVLKNCSIAGEPYKIDSKTRKVILKGNHVETQPLDQKLDQSVRKYQDKLFDAREEVKKMIALDQESLTALESAKVDLPQTEISLRPQKETEQTDGVTTAQAQEYFATAKEELKQVIRDVPNLANAVEQATRTAIDASALR